MSLNSFVTPFSASSSYWNLAWPFLNSGKSDERSCLSPALADLKWATHLLVRWEYVFSPPLVKIPLKNASKLCHSAPPAFYSKGIPWRLGCFRNWQSDQCIFLDHHIYILLKNKGRTLHYSFRSELRRLCRMLGNWNFHVIFFACVCARRWIMPLWVRP